MCDIPMALITEILSRLPVKSLLRFRNVAKSWRSLIDSSYFINLHLQNACYHQSIILKELFPEDKSTEPSLYSVDFPSLNYTTPIDFHFPVEYYVTCICRNVGRGVYVNECMNWVAFRKPVLAMSDEFKLILAFNLATEEFNVVPWPREKLNCKVKLGILEGCLMVQYINHNVETKVWIMKEYNVDESWTKLFTIPLMESLHSLGDDLKCLAYSKRNGVQEILFEKEHSKLVHVNVQGGGAKHVKTLGISSALDAVLLVQSFVSLEEHEEKVA